MKTTKIITNLATLNLVLFMSLASIANSNNRNSGENENTIVKNKVSVVKSSNLDMTSPSNSENEFNYLRFDVNKFINESEISIASGFNMYYLHFNVNNFIDLNETEISEMPSMVEFGYLYFDVNVYLVCNSAFELPFNEFDYLRFDVNRFSVSDSLEIGELPAC